LAFIKETFATNELNSIEGENDENIELYRSTNNSETKEMTNLIIKKILNSYTCHQRKKNTMTVNKEFDIIILQSKPLPEITDIVHQEYISFT
jgi:hypothetical protein